MAIRVLVVEGSALMQRVLVDLLESQPGVEVVGSTRKGDEAVRLTSDLRPDVVTLDVELPGKGGPDTLGGIMSAAPTPVVLFSTATAFGAQATLEALDKGAIDFVCKPRSGSLDALTAVRDELITKMQGAVRAPLGRKPRRGIAAALPARPSERILLVTAGMGGPRALVCLFETLPKGLDVPILIAQHMPAGFTGALARRLSRIGSVPCREAQEGDVVTAGQALLAPGGKHMTVTGLGDIEIIDGPPLLARPAGDHLLGSAADVYGNRCLALVLTGMGADGAEGGLAIRRRGGTVLCESESSCTLYDMPSATKAIGAADGEYPIHEIGHAAVAVLGRRATKSA